MHLELPLEQLAKRRGAAFQFAFATQAKELMPEPDGFAFTASHKGLHVLAENEDALARPVEVLREVYGANLELAPPRVRLIEGVQGKQPIMQVRVSIYADFREAVKTLLTRRGAKLWRNTCVPRIASCGAKHPLRIYSVSRPSCSG
jgi:hypothetical protein